ncbi:hypothetical protein HanRHA438_Chr17g0811191 [Helianthus annuus]|nr:hypothetical protein HanRHA438_Chr17g0811191 [Helianthus annuus]
MCLRAAQQGDLLSRLFSANKQFPYQYFLLERLQFEKSLLANSIPLIKG